MEPNVLFSDFRVPLYGGIVPGVSAAGTHSGAVVPLSILAIAPFRKITFELALLGAASGAATLWLYSAAVSSGSYSAISGFSQSISVSASTQLGVVELETRTDFLADLGLSIGGGIQPVVIIGTACPVYLTVNAWNSGIAPARRLLSNAAFANIAFAEADMLGATTGGPAVVSPQ